MSENADQQTTEPTEAKAAKNGAIKLNGLYAFKQGMSSIYDDQGRNIPVTVLKYEPWMVSQVKSQDKDGYAAVQVACRPKKAKNSNAAETGRLKAAGFENGAALTYEIRQDLPEGIEVGQKVAIDSLEKGDVVKMTGYSKGRGYAGVMKRWNFGGGPASHGSGFHRRPGSIGNRTWPGRVMAGRKMSGHFGNEKITVKNVQIVDVIPEENVVLVKGAVPGARNSLVKLMKA